MGIFQLGDNSVMELAELVTETGRWRGDRGLGQSLGIRWVKQEEEHLQESERRCCGGRRRTRTGHREGLSLPGPYTSLQGGLSRGS